MSSCNKLCCIVKGIMITTLAYLNLGLKMRDQLDQHSRDAVKESHNTPTTAKFTQSGKRLINTGAGLQRGTWQ
jgi:hypothetical protein